MWNKAENLPEIFRKVLMCEVVEKKLRKWAKVGERYGTSFWEKLMKSCEKSKSWPGEAKEKLLGSEKLGIIFHFVQGKNPLFKLGKPFQNLLESSYLWKI